MTLIHPTAVVEEGAELGDNVRIGPFCVIGAHAKLHDNAELKSHVVVAGHTEIGADVTIFPFASIGHQPQDLKFRGEVSRLVIGARTVIREHVTINPGTEGGGLETSIGEDCLIMIGAHIAHDCRIGNHVILVNNVLLAGHVTIEDYAIIGGQSAIHQWVRIGEHAFIGGMTGVENDVIPFGSVLGSRGHLGGLNLVGMKRSGFNRDSIHDLRRAYRMLFADEGTLLERVDDVGNTFPEDPLVGKIVEFIRAASDRALCTPR